VLIHVSAAMGAFSQVVPPIAALAANRLDTAARRATAIWCILLFCGDAAHLMVTIARSMNPGGNGNLWVGYVVTLLSASAGLWALSLWHERASIRRGILWTIPLLVIIGVVITSTLEDLSRFSLVATPLNAAVVLVVTAGSFVVLSQAETGTIGRTDWFWILGGIMLYQATVVGQQPVAWFLNASDRGDLLVAAYVVRGFVDVVAFLIIAWGMLSPSTAPAPHRPLAPSTDSA
jgi:hypothetical protein